MGAREIVQASKAFDRDEKTGLTLPVHVLEEKKDAERTRVRWTWGRFKKIRAVARDLSRLNPKFEGPTLIPLYVCDGCKQPLTVVPLDGANLVELDDTKLVNKIALRCDCTDRVLVAGV